jgi:hypothetical protein
MGKSRGERRVIFSSSGAIHTTSASHLRRLLAGTAARATETPPDAETPRAPGGVTGTGGAAGAKRHQADAMGRAQESLTGKAFPDYVSPWVEAGERSGEFGMELGFAFLSCAVLLPAS